MSTNEDGDNIDTLNCTLIIRHTYGYEPRDQTKHRVPLPSEYRDIHTFIESGWSIVQPITTE